MDIINILPDSVANQIAAGEVVDRPASAVKELLENAMDAGATQIDLVVKDAGRTLIQVVDNGCGMSDSDARLCFERHATSKIHRADDLFAIQTMGFRGEALASIAAIAQVELKTRMHDNELGTQVLIEGSQIVSQQPTACAPGTSLAVKNLFFNVPARRNFLKKDSVELSHIEEVFRRVTLIHYDLGFSLTSNGRVLYDLQAGSMLQRIAGLYGNHYKERFFNVEEQTDLLKIKGFVGKPEYSRKTRGEQYLFVNGRFIKHPALSAAVEKAYSDLLPEHSYPSYFIGLQVDPARIDINIHPTKTEVKFVDEHAMFAILRSAVKKALGQFTLATELEFDTPAEFNIPPAPKGYVPPEPKISYNPNYNPFGGKKSEWGERREGRDRIAAIEGIEAIDRIDKSTPSIDSIDSIPAIETPPPPRQATCLQVQGRYIVTTLSSGLAVIDQQRAHERVLYERLSTPTSDLRPPTSQALLFPVNCQFTPADADLFGELMPDLREYGFAIDPVGQCTFVVTATPPDIKESELQTTFDHMLLDYKSATLQKYSNRTQTLCASLARQMAVKAGTPLGQEEMQQLVADLFACPMPETSPSGKKIITVVKTEEILK
ncbi:MAG: DNA mismatch repair endonuclease MutL [Bacteroidales bacterium]|nr:DNA mismatch repair endonuclease MutL [Bacteroidales bacterium]